MAIAPLLVGIRTAGAAALGRASAAFRRLAANVRVASNRMANSFIARGGFAGAFGRIAARVGHATRALGRFAAAAGRAARVGGRIAAASAPYAVLAAKILLVVAAATTLLGVAGNLLGAVQLIAPAVVAAAAGMAVLKMATAGVGDAWKAGIEGDVEALSKALKKLHPNAKEAVLTMLDLRREWKRTQQSVQGAFFAGFRGDIIAVSRALQPIADRWLPKISTAFATARHALRYVFTEAAKSGQLDKIFAGVTRFFQGLLNAVAPLGQALLDVAEVASGAFGDIGGGIAAAAQKFADWIRAMKDSGKLQEWLDRAMRSLGELKSIAGNVGEMLAAIFRGSSEQGESFLQKLDRITQKMADWLNSSDGQGLINTLASILAFLIACEPAFKVLGVVMGAVLAVATTMWGTFFNIVQGIVTYILGAYQWLLEGAAKAFSWIPGLGPKLQAAADQFGRWKDQVNAAMDGIKKTIDITVRYKALRVGPHMVGGLISGAQQQGEWSSGIGGRASGGPMRAGITYRINEQGQEFIQLGTAGRAYNARESKAMASPGGTAPTWSGSMGGLDALFFRWLQQSIRTGKLKLA